MARRSLVLTHRPSKAAAAAAGLLVLLGCAPWTSIPAPAPATLPPATRLQLWLGRRSLVLGEVTVEADSIRGRTADRFGAHSVAWVVIPRTEVDSFKVRHADRANWFGVGVGVGLASGIVATAAFFRAALGD